MGMFDKTSSYLDEYIRGLYGWDYEVTSEPTPEYNCLAYAADEDDRIWLPRCDPYAFWPEGATNDVTIEAFIEAYSSLGYQKSPDDSFDPEYDKIVIYLDADGVPTHAAKQIDELYWKSKLGNCHDIKHPLRALEEAYGKLFVFLHRPRRLGSAQE